MNFNKNNLDGITFERGDEPIYYKIASIEDSYDLVTIEVYSKKDNKLIDTTIYDKYFIVRKLTGEDQYSWKIINIPKPEYSLWL